MRLLCALLLCCVSPMLYAAAPVQRIEASFDVSARGTRIAEIHEKFVRDGKHYRIESITKPVGLLALFKPDTLSVVSEGDIAAYGLRPHNFLYQYTQDTNKNTAARFDWKQSSLTLEDRDGQRVVPLPAQTQDRLSAPYQFHYIKALGERKEVTLHITNGSKIDMRHYLVQPGQALTGPMGTLQTLYLSTPAEATPWKTEIWLSVAHDNFPCRIVLTQDNGEQLTQVLTALSIVQ